MLSPGFQKYVARWQSTKEHFSRYITRGNSSRLPPKISSFVPFFIPIQVLPPSQLAFCFACCLKIFWPAEVSILLYIPQTYRERRKLFFCKIYFLLRLEGCKKKQGSSKGHQWRYFFLLAFNFSSLFFFHFAFSLYPLALKTAATASISSSSSFSLKRREPKMKEERLLLLITYIQTDILTQIQQDLLLLLLMKRAVVSLQQHMLCWCRHDRPEAAAEMTMLSLCMCACI